MALGGALTPKPERGQAASATSTHRMDDHPGIVFRDGPTGRRAGLAAGPDVWEVIGALRSTGLDGDEAIQATVEWSGLTVRQVRDAIGYYSEYPVEVDERIRLNESDAPSGAGVSRASRGKLLLDEMISAVVAEQLRARDHTSTRSSSV